MKHNRKSMRLRNYDYSKGGAYFVTICSFEKMNIFGKIVKGKMVLNKSGDIVCSAWKKIPNHYEDVEIDEFIIMPNHVHGIILLGRGAIHRAQGRIHRAQGCINETESAMNCARTQRLTCWVGF